MPLTRHVALAGSSNTLLAFGAWTTSGFAGTVPVALVHADKPADGADVFADLAFLQHTQFGQPSIVGVWVVDLVTVQAQDGVRGILQIPRFAQVASPPRPGISGHCQLNTRRGAGI